MKVEITYLPPREKRWSEMNKWEKARLIGMAGISLALLAYHVSRA